jgi:hypothetical protein
MNKDENESGGASSSTAVEAEATQTRSRERKPKAVKAAEDSEAAEKREKESATAIEALNPAIQFVRTYKTKALSRPERRAWMKALAPLSKWSVGLARVDQ